MVTTRNLLIVLFVVFVLTTNASSAGGQQRQFHLEHEWSKIWINQDGAIDLLNDISITLDSGPDINYVSVGQPQRDFTVGSAVDQYGNLLETNDVSSGNDYEVEVKLSKPLVSGQTIRFNLTTNVAEMIYEDTQNPGNVGMQFIPTWWQEARIRDLRVLIVLPPGVSQDKVKTTINWDNVLSESDQLAIYWERQGLVPNQQFVFGISFPKEFIQSYTSKPTGVTAFLQQYGPAFLVTIAAVGLVGVIVFKARKRSYRVPMVSIETLGIRRGLTAVEASLPPRCKTNKNSNGDSLQPSEKESHMG
jgi:hypothetical protein